MTKRLKGIMLLLAAFFAVSTAMAQQMPIPTDSAVRIGRLPNGLTYYIRHNETPKGQADFYIAQKVGSILEEENQRGLAHFLEHMCFNGTSHFPGNEIIDWLETVGVKFGQNLNAYTAVDQTVYNISNVPVARTGVQDSCLLILHDWANDLLLDPEEIDKERGVIHEEWRRTNVGQMRILENLLPVIYPGSKYGERLPIGTMEVVDNFPPQALRDYYETWYRPDQQGIIVVGDIDVDYIEGKIKEIFADIEMPENAKERVYEPVANTPGTIYAIGSDPEQKVGLAEIFFKTDAFPDEMKGDVQYLIMKYMINMAFTMLNARIDEIGSKPDAPFAQAGASFGDFLLAKTKNAATVVSVAKGNDIVPGLEAVYREVLRATKHGFTVGEYERAKAEYLSNLEKQYNGRDKRQSAAYVDAYVNNFVDNEPIPSIEDRYELMKQIVPMLPLEAINSILPELIGQDNRVVVVLAPEKEGYTEPTQAEVAQMMARVEAEPLEAYQDQMKEEPLIPALPQPGKVVSVEDNAQWGAKVITLSNGVKVWVKKTDFKKDDIRFAAQAIGGTSTIGDEKANSLMVLPLALQQHGLGTYTSVDLQKYMQGKQASVMLDLSNYDRSLSGSSSVKDLPSLMELIYMTFVDFTLDADEFQAMQNMYAGILANQEVDPQYVFQKDLQEALYTSEAERMISSAAILAADREDIASIIRSQLANAADYTFYFVGDVDVETLTPLLEQYIATLPASAATATTTYEPNLGREIKAGSETAQFSTKMETPQTWCAILINGNMPYTPKDKALSSIVGQILSNRLLKKIREEMGAVYSIGAGSGMSRLGASNTTIQIPFPMKPEMKNQVLEEIHKMVYDMAKNVKKSELTPIIEYMVKNATEDKEQNGAWIGVMSATQLNGVDTFNGNIDVLNSITTEDVKAFMKELLDQNNYKVIILDPAE